MSSPYQEELEFAIKVVNKASVEIRRLYEDRSAATYIKDDHSPVTDADLASDRIIRESLAERYPADAVLTEEGIDDESRLAVQRCWIADPIDGTQQFVDRTGQFDVLLALVVDGRPVVSVISQPATGLYLAAEAGQGAFGGFVGSDIRMPVKLPSPDQPVRWGTTIWLGSPDTLPYLERVAARAAIEPPVTTTTGVIPRQYMEPGHPLLTGTGSAVASPPDSPLHAFVGLPLLGDGSSAWEWDFVAADLIVHEAGGRFTDARGRLHRYNRRRPRNEGGLIIANTPELHERLVDGFAPEMDLVEALHRKE
jgi:3'-phosphoadenosine 5'-phosphosulfate (PAPS) 3'-phosphatase